MLIWDTPRGLSIVSHWCILFWRTGVWVCDFGRRETLGLFSGGFPILTRAGLHCRPMRSVALFPFIRQSTNEAEVVKPFYPLFVLAVAELLLLEHNIKFIRPFDAAAKSRF